MQVTILHPPINLTERGQPQFVLPGINGELDAPPSGKTTPKLGPAPLRSPGLHVSTLLKRIAIALGLIKSLKAMGGKWKAEPVIDEEAFPLQMALGLAYEDFMSLQYPEMIYHPGELVLDGIAGSPDGITPLPDLPQYEGLGDAVVDEFKFTYKSGRHDINHPNYKMWLWQIMAYCKMLGVLCARLHVLFVNGCYDYAAPGLPCLYRIYCIQFTQDELDRNWEMLLTEKQALEAECAS